MLVLLNAEGCVLFDWLSRSELPFFQVCQVSPHFGKIYVISTAKVGSGRKGDLVDPFRRGDVNENGEQLFQEKT